MSMDFQPIATMTHLSLFASADCEEISQDTIGEMDLPEKPEAVLKTPAKEYKLTENFKPFLLSKEIKQYLTHSDFSKSASSYQNGEVKSHVLRTQIFSQYCKKQTAEKNASDKFHPRDTSTSNSLKSAAFPPATNRASKQESTSLSEKRDLSTSREQKNHSLNARNALQSKQWSQQDTLNFWQTRYHKQDKERERGHAQDQGKQQQEDQDKKEKKHLIEKVGKTSFGSKNDHSNRDTFQKPILERPKTGIFALYFILTKIGIFSDGSSNFSYKKEIEFVDSETTDAHKKRLEEMKKALDKENSSRRWGIAEKVFSWIGSLFGIISGIVLIATGVGAVAGAMMVAAGVIQITNQILEMSGGWRKIAEMLPGDDIEKKRAVVSWMQLGIAVLCLVLSGAGIIWGGYSNFGEAMQTASAMIGGIAAMGHGVTAIGQGISTYKYKDKFGEVKLYEKRLAELKHMRDDLMDKVEGGVDRLEQLFEDLSKALEFEVELFRADQMINRG